MKKSASHNFKHRALVLCIAAALMNYHSAVFAVEFNTELLDANDKSNIDLSRFAQAGYIMPGTYTLTIRVNGHAIKDADITFYERPDKKEGNGPVPVEACLSPEQVPLLGLKEDLLAKITWWRDGQCADFSALPGITLTGNLADSILNIAIPQAWMEYQDATWLPPSRWEDGIPGIMMDYNVNTSVTRQARGSNTENASGTGSVGANLGPWRLRGDWQANYTSAGNYKQQSFDWSRIYAYRAIRSLHSKLTVGEDYLTSDIFDSWRFTGASLVSDDRMLPPRLRGYAPEVSGIARTNAKVVVSQQGRVLYETTVAAGPFRIQDLSDSVNGKLDVRVEEQDGGVQTFQVDTSSIPYLTRPGQVRYKLAMGKPSDYDHHTEGPSFGTGEFSWGISNAWSLYGGAIVAGNYNSAAIGLGRDLLALGTISADVTQSVANLPGADRRQGKSWRVSYSKRFDEINSEITFAGYRFSERDYMSMGEYLDTRYHGGRISHDKELYTITASKSFTDLRISAYLSYSHQTYWDRDATNRYSASISRYFDIGDLQNIAATLSATRSDYNGRRDDAAYLSLSVPIGKGTASYNANLNNSRLSQTAGWYQRLDNGDTYRINTGAQSGNGESVATQASGYYTHEGDIANVTGNAAWLQNGYSSAGISLSGGMTATTKGAALHPGGARGGTRMLISTDGVGGVPVEHNEHTNAFGIAVVPDVSSYYLNTMSLDVTHLPDDVEAGGSPVAEAALTEGAIGYRHFSVLKGAKVVGVIRLEDGSHPPFGSSVRNADDRELGIVSDDGLVWLTGITPGQTLSVSWNSKIQCMLNMPKVLPASQLLLPCLTQGVDATKIKKP